MIRALPRLLLPLLCAARIATAQPLPDRAPLSGVALDEAGKPLAGALISLRRQEANGPYTFWGATTASDARGAWRFPQSEAGRYYLSAEAPGFAPLPNQSFHWKAGDASLRLRFDRLLALQLKLFAPDGKALANAPAWIRLRGDGTVGQLTRRLNTDGEGVASLDGLLPATYALFLAAPGGFAIQNGLSLRAGKTLELTLQRGGALAANVTQNGASRGVGGAILSLTPENPAEAARALGNSADGNENVALLASGGDSLSLLSRDGDGQIEIQNLPPGRYLARLLSSQYAAPEPRGFTVVAGQTTNLDLELAPLSPANSSPFAALTLNLRSKKSDGTETPAPPREWSLRVLPIDANGALAPDTSPDTLWVPGGNVARRARSDERGQITLFPLRAGRYRVFVAPRTSPAQGAEPEAASLDVSVPAAGAAATLVVPAAP